MKFFRRIREALTKRWRPATGGRRFESVVLYTREGCHLCDEAAALLTRYQQWIPPAVEVDIDRDPGLRERFHIRIPVVEIDGKVRFQGRVSEPLLRRLIEGTKPR